MTGEATRRVFEAMGYGGIVDFRVDQKFGSTQIPYGNMVIRGVGMPGIYPGDAHVIVFRNSDIRQLDSSPIELDSRFASMMADSADVIKSTEEAARNAIASVDWGDAVIVESRYAAAGEDVSGMNVLENVPNYGSIDASFEDGYHELPGIREVPIADFILTGRSYSTETNAKIDSLEDDILGSAEIEPLIVVIDSDGPYILEGSHRIEALYNLGKKTFPAIVIIDLDLASEPLGSGSPDPAYRIFGGRR